MTTTELDKARDTNNQPNPFSVAIAELGSISIKMNAIHVAITQALHGLLEDHEGSKLAEDIEQIASLHMIGIDLYDRLESCRQQLCEFRPDLPRNGGA